MTHPARLDYPGSEHHVYNRGIARRTVFESRKDIRYFQSLLARKVRAGKIEILAFSILTTHYHLWVRSTTGELSKTIGWVMREYVRYFNRSRRRDGPLFRGRFGSRLVNSDRYRRIILKYVDDNPVQARIAKRPWLYTHGSARMYCSPRRPKWLSTAYVDQLLGNPTPEERLRRYAAAFGSRLDPAERELVERRLASPARSDDEFDDLVDIAPPAVLRWMKKKAALADGTEVGCVCCTPTRIQQELLRVKRRAPDWRCKPNGRYSMPAWPIAEAALLRHLGGLSCVEIGTRLGTTARMASTRLQQHVRLLEADGRYASLTAELASACMRSAP